MSKTKREKHLDAITGALTLIFGEHDSAARSRYRELAEAILDAIQDPPPKPKGRAADPAVGRIIALYCDTWRTAHRSERSPTIRPQDSAQVRGLVQSAGEEQAARLVQAFFAMPVGYYSQRRHPIDLLMRDLNAIQAFADGAGMVTRAQGQSIDSRAGLESQLERIDKRDL